MIRPPCRADNYSTAEIGRSVPQLRLRADQCPSIFDLVADLNRDVDRQGLVAGSADFDVMGAGRQVEVLKVAVEVVDDTRIVPIDKYHCVSRLDDQANAARGTIAVERVRRISEPGVRSARTVSV